MSAIALHDLQDLEPVRTRQPQRDHLRLLPAWEGVGEGPRDGARDGGALTLTRRGRLAITLTVATALVVTVIAALGMVSATAVGAETITVQPGQTLSEIAVTEMRGVPMDRAIVQIQLANELNTLHVQAGMELEIPQP